MKRIVVLCIALASITFAQIPDTAWTGVYGGPLWEEGWEVQQTSDSGYIVIGLTQSFGVGGTDCYLIRIDANGDTIWTKTYGGAENDGAYAGQITSDGGYIMAGYTYSFGVQACDVYLIKTYANGDTIWTKTYGGFDYDIGWSVAQTTDGGYIIGGTTTSFGAGSRDMYLIRTQSSGDTIWTRTYGGSDEDWCFSVEETSDGGYIAVGDTRSFGAGGRDLYLIRTDSLGNTLWNKTYGGTGSDRGYAVHQLTDGGFIAVGRTAFGAGGGDVWLLRFDTAGDTIWTKTYGGGDLDEAWALTQPADSGYFLVGYTNSFGGGYGDVYIIRTGVNGDSLWAKVVGLGYTDEGHSVQETFDGGLIIAGTANTYASNTGDVYVIKLEPDIGIEDDMIKIFYSEPIDATIFSGPLQLPEDKQWKVFDVIGRVMDPNRLTRGVYFVEIDGVVTQKVVKVR